MTENLTEAMRLWPWAVWVSLAGLAAAVWIVRRTSAAGVAVGGFLAAAAVAAVGGAWPAHFLGLAVGLVVGAVLLQPWRDDETEPRGAAARGH